MLKNRQILKMLIENVLKSLKIYDTIFLSGIDIHN